MDLKPSKTIRPFPSFSLPKAEGFFSLDKNRVYHASAVNLKYLNIPKKVNFNLNLGDEIYHEKPASADTEQITHLLTFIMRNPNILEQKPAFVCFRGLLSLIMNTPYENKDNWIVKAIKFNGTIYLCAEETEQKKTEKMRRTHRDIKFMRYGFKFETHILSEEPTKPPPGSRKPLFEAEEFCVMFSTEIDGKKILYGAEMDGVISKTPVSTLDQLRQVPMVEVKVKRRESNEKQMTNFYRFKARKWWVQSFIVGIDSVFAGVRNDGGFVEEVNRIPLKELSDEAKRCDYWHGTVCMNFLNDFIKKISSDMQKIDSPYIVYRYEWDQSRSNFITSRKIEDKNYSFLTAEYITFIENSKL